MSQLLKNQFSMAQFANQMSSSILNPALLYLMYAQMNQYKQPQTQNLNTPLKLPIINNSNNECNAGRSNVEANTNLTHHQTPSKSPIEQQHNPCQLNYITGTVNSTTSSMGIVQLQHNEFNKRVRTKMTRQQVNLMRLIFVDCNKPTKQECEHISHYLNLKEKVIQTWFQNHRTKEKKHLKTLEDQTITNSSSILLAGSTAEDDLTSFEFSQDECLICDIKYTNTLDKREHIFSKDHIDSLINFLNSFIEDSSSLSNNGINAEESHYSEDFDCTE
jgi:hypothetical protein